MQQVVDFGIEGVACLARDDPLARGGGQARSAGRARSVVLDSFVPVDRILDRTVPGAAAQVALQEPRQILTFLLGEVGRRHDHSGRAETALKALGFEERSLHRVQLSILRQTFDRCDLAAFGAEGRNDTAVDRNPIKPDGARPAIAGIAPLLDAEPAQFAQEGAQALAGRGLVRERLAVDVIAHISPHAAWLPESSRRISSAKWKVRCWR